MKKSVKAAMFSAIVFPGAGHIFLKKYLLGASLIMVAGLMLTTFVQYVFQVIERVVNTLFVQVEQGQLSADVSDALARVFSLVHQFMAENITEIPPSALLNISPKSALDIFVIIWLIAIIDAYRLGKNEMMKRPTRE